jgi:hypothetical protein
LVVAGADRWGLRRLVVALVLVQSLGMLWGNLRSARALQADQSETRAVDVALEEAQAGDALYLLSPPLFEDDDKRAHSPVLSRLSPWQPMPMAHPYVFPTLDYRHGQPRQIGGLTLYVNDHPYAEISQAISAHATLFLVVYDHREDPRFTADLEERFGTAAERVGSDLLFRLQGE